MTRSFLLRISVSVLFGLCPALVFAQSTVTVSDAIEGGEGGVWLARCGNGVVAGFGDLESSNPNSNDGVSSSTNGAKSFIDLGTIVPAQSDDLLGPFEVPQGLPTNSSLACS